MADTPAAARQPGDADDGQGRRPDSASGPPGTGQASESPADPERRRFLSWLPLKLLDVVALLCSAGVAAAMTGWVLGGRRGRPIIRVTSADAAWLLQPDTDQVLEVSGPLGANRVVVRDGSVFVESAPCANQICVKTGRVSRPGQWIACLPNRVFVAVEGGGEEAIDARSY